MSYLNVPRLHFAGRFQADPSTINNNDNNWDPSAQYTNAPPGDLTNYSVYWNPTGTHNWKLVDCSIRGAANDRGPVTADPVIGAKVLSEGQYPAKIVDLDPDNQSVSQIWGLRVQISIADPKDATKVLASVTAEMPPTAFCDLWNRSTNAPRPGMSTMSAAFQAVLQNVAWVNAPASPLLAKLQQLSPKTLSIRFIVDSFQPSSNQSNFTFGRVVGTIGPAFAGEAPRSTPRRLAQAGFFPSPPYPPSPSIFSTYGPVGAVWDNNRRVLILDMGNCVPTNGTPPTSGSTVPDAGWPINDTTFQLAIPGPSVTPPSLHTSLKSGGSMKVECGAPSVLGTVKVTLATYLTYAGIVEIPVTDNTLASLLQAQPMTLTDVTNSAIAAKEDLLGRYVDVDIPFFRLNPGEQRNATLWATRFGQPWSGAPLDLAVQPPAPVNNPGPPQPPGTYCATWKGGTPAGIVKLTSGSSQGTAITATTGSDGTALVGLTAGDPGTPRKYANGQMGPDGQVYFVTGSWQSWGQIFLFSGAPINIMVFSGYAIPTNPNWTQHVGPILSEYARMYPYMKGIVDLGDFATVKENAQAIQYVLNLPQTDPHHMPIVRDLSQAKLAMINKWFANGMPQSLTADIV